MTDHIRAFSGAARFILQRLAFLLIVLLSLGLAGYTAACALGYAPWLDLSLSFGAYSVPEAGPIVQGLVTALAVALAFFLPTNARVMALETSHRDFAIGMRDVTRAYAVAHARDREHLFNLSSEFDSIRARMAFLRDHPDLGELEPSVLEVAAQMSHVSAELARVYSDAGVRRAKDFLIQRQIEIEEFNTRLQEAKAVATEMRQWIDQVEMEEAVAEAQLSRLCDELSELLPELGLSDPELSPAPATDAPPLRGIPAANVAEPGLSADMEFPDDSDRIVALLAKRAAE